MQLTGSQFTTSTALAGNDLATLPDFPAEIRAPAGTLPGVSGYQIHFSSSDVFTPGDNADVLVAMNPAALKANIGDLRAGGLLIVNTDSFKQKDLDKAGYQVSPLEDHSLDRFQVISIDLTRLTRQAVEEIGLDTRSADRCKNLFALGMMYWLFDRPLDSTLNWLQKKFGARADLLEANRRALQAGWSYCEATEVFHERYHVPRFPTTSGLYRNIAGNTSTALGLVAAAHRSKLPLFYASYPITPASDVLHELAQLKRFGVITFQAEDEIAAISAAIGASYAGTLGVTCTSGPGMALKTEALGLATIAELPLVVIDVQRGGPSTGLPTKTEQADLLQALYGRNSEAPIPVLAAATASDCFRMSYEAVRIAITHMTPVILLTDGYIANGAEPWLVPKVEELPEISVSFRTDPENFFAYERDPQTLARPWAIPGTKGLEHRIGGLEKADRTGHVSYDPLNHEHMVRTRAAKVERVVDLVPDQTVEGDEAGSLLVLGWGSTYGAIQGAVRRARSQGLRVGHAHLRYLNPFPKNLESVMSRFEKVLVPELNMGQLAFVLQGRFVRPVESLTKIQGKPFTEVEVLNRILELAPGSNGKGGAA
ncbi:MAG: 2-oxoacid:acceptor oxidoreductase subunit alpha [Candidatus Eisenbacteria bacterium]|uniref:2-oxoacid:acceptor oxidoreductase subunit alpha n=1 Tax=Eiseniibacteriota bacterium TaxID=2212470 RepID=A0A956LXY5_UNCEI|nr:2-oxoacid:acceptor oxidoreductase subunit alpha [Candidatus Eisenbacteria bacterium]